MLCQASHLGTQAKCNAVPGFIVAEMFQFSDVVLMIPPAAVSLLRTA